jgi:hypothetical protein
MPAIENISSIEIPCKYYIKIYFENNCGIPVDLSIFPVLANQLKSLISLVPLYEKRLSTIYEPETIIILIPEEWNFVNNYSISYQNMRRFTSILESHLKCIMREHIKEGINFGRSLAASIRDFQEEFCMPEEVWPFESIKKDCDRCGIKSLRHIVFSKTYEPGEIWI